MDYTNILEMDKNDLLRLEPERIQRLIRSDEIIHMAKTLGAFWSYDYGAAAQGRVGYHASIKSKLHTDKFFYSKIMLKHENIRKIIANQMAMRISGLVPKPDRVAGVPDGATELFEELAKILGAEVVEMRKIGGKISLVSKIKAGEWLLLGDDFCTEGTGFKEAIWDIVVKCPHIRFVPFEPVIINRGGREYLYVTGVELFKIVPIANYQVNNWPKEECPRCFSGSIAISPKENWDELNASQQG